MAAWLLSGQIFKGQQSVPDLDGKEASWEISIKFLSVDWKHGLTHGIMSAINVPKCLVKNVQTVFSGEIIDGVNHTFATGWGGSSCITDLAHWKRFPGFTPFLLEFESYVHPGPPSASGNGDVEYDRSWISSGPPTFITELRRSDYVYMRLNEKEFLNTDFSCGLTINGFYYACMAKRTGKMEAFYFDPSIRPFQKVVASPVFGLEQRMQSGSCDVR